MAIVYATSFEAGSQTWMVEAGWTISSSNTPTTLRVHRTPAGLGGAYALDLAVGFSVVTPSLGTTGRWMHFAVQPRVPGSPATLSFAFQRAGGTTFFVRINAPGGSIDLLRGTASISAATVVATSAGTIALGVPHWLAFELLAADAGGAAAVWVDGVSMVSFAGDTKGHATLANWDQMQLSGISGAANSDMTIDDLIVTDVTTGRVAEQFCQTLTPNAVASGNLTGVPVTLANRYQNIDEIPVSLVDYNEAAAINDEDLYDFSNPATPSSVLCVVVWVEAARAGAITKIAASIKSGATTVYASDTTLPTSGFQAVPFIRETDPDTAVAWTGGGLNAMQAGAKFT